jgi:4-hydroxythreonine-4-phosphate dehydrogenase
VSVPSDVRVAVTLGDPAGIGPEVTSAALRTPLEGLSRICVFGDQKALERAGGVPAGVECVHFASAEVTPGRPDAAAALGVVEAIRSAARACLAGEFDALVTAPIAKEMLWRAGFPYPGHTELLAEICGKSRAVMLLCGGSLRVIPATVHCALREVPERISTQGLVEILEVLGRELAPRFGLGRARIAVCGLNPHAGEGGQFGDEEQRIIAPAVREAVARGIDAHGPLSADSLFTRVVAGEFDAVLGMYHDQVLGPLKLHAFGRAVNVTLGLPLVRTSVDHGTAFDIAGQGRADCGSMREALRLAVELVRNQRRGAAA